MVYICVELTQPAITCSKLTIETLEQGVKYVIAGWESFCSKNLAAFYIFVDFDYIEKSQSIQYMI